LSGPKQRIADRLACPLEWRFSGVGAESLGGGPPFEFLDRPADLVPPPRKHRHRYHGVFDPNHKLRRAVTTLAIGHIGKRGRAATGGQASDGRATGGCCDTHAKPRSHDTSRIAWAKLMARVGEESANHSNRRRFHKREARPPNGPSSSSPMITATQCRRRPTSCPRSTSKVADRCRKRGHDKAARPPDSERLCAGHRKTPRQGGGTRSRNRLLYPGRRRHAAHEPLVSS
jgi:hypothetical protein